MRWPAASLAAALIAIGTPGCDGGGAEPDAPREPGRAVTLVLDFQPNAVHTGIYSALARGGFADQGLEVAIREPSDATAAPRLLESGRAEFAIVDIHDLALARAEGADIVAFGAIVQRPLAAVIAADRDRVRRPSDLAGARVGVTGLPSDEAVLDAVLESDGTDPGSVDRVTIGFRSVASLAAGRVAAATAFWNAEGVQLRELGVETREFRVDRYGAPSYPELVIATSRELAEAEPELIGSMRRALRGGYSDVLRDPEGTLEELIESVPGLDAEAQRSQLEAIGQGFAPPLTLSRPVLERWSEWEAERGIVAAPPDIDEAFVLPSREGD